MAVEISIPTIGESITEVTLSSWHKKSGDQVEKNEIICEIESDKAGFEIQAEVSGQLEILVLEGEDIAIGTVIALIEESNKSQSTAVSSPSISSEDKSEDKIEDIVTQVVIPSVGESIVEVGIANWLKQDGEFINKGDIICELESDKAELELPAEASGILKILTTEVENIAIGTVIAQITGEKPAELSQTEQKIVSDTSYAKGHPAPAAQKILTEKGLKTQEVQGTGVKGRITKTDALNAQPKPVLANKSEVIKDQKVDSPTETTSDRQEKRMRLSSLRKVIAKRLVSAKNETAMLTTFNEVDMKAVMDIRKSYKEKFKAKHETGLGFMSFFTKAICIALQEWPAVNAQIDGNESIYHDYCDISIAVSSPKGLVVPVIRNAEKLTFDEIEKEVIRLAKKARDNKLTISEMSGGTFTITNGGIFGSMLSTPILNAPQSGILGMHNIVQRPVVIDGEVVVRPIMYVALSYDHRIIDGRESVSFLYRVKELIEDPIRLLINV